MTDHDGTTLGGPPAWLADRIAAAPLELVASLLSGDGPWRSEGIPELGLEPAFLADGPHGLRRVPDPDADGIVGSSWPATCFPPAVALGATWDPALAEEVGAAIGAEAQVQGVDVVLGPGMNLKRHPRGGRSFEYMAEDPVLGGRMAAALTRGIQSTGVAACIKHFAVNNQESNRFVVDAIVDERTLRELYLAGFELAIAEGEPRTIMSSYNLLNGTHTSDDHWLMTEVLREEWGYDGLVMSDWAAVSDRVAAVNAGLDLEMPGNRGENDRRVVAAVEEGRLDRAAVNIAAGRVAALALESRRSARTGGELDVAGHHAIARRAAAAATVLLTNREDTLPLAPSTSIALIGRFAEEPRIQGGGSSHVVTTRLDTPLAALRAAAPGRVTYAPGYAQDLVERSDALLDDAVEVAAGADVAVVLVGLPPSFESEGFDRTSSALPASHDELVRRVAAVAKRTVVVLQHGAAVALPWRDDVDAILDCLLSGQASGTAMADILLGDAEPGGRLAETYPVVVSDLPADAWFPGQRRQVQHREAMMVGYRFTDSAGVDVAFPFGHGLSYTSWSLADVRAVVDGTEAAQVDVASLRAGTDVELVAEVTNTGERAGSTVVQVYAGRADSAVVRPVHELVGFTKVDLDAGATTTVRLAVPWRRLAHWDTGSGGWAVEAGSVTFELGWSSRDIAATATVELTGDESVTASSPEVRATWGAPRWGRDVTDDEFTVLLGHDVPPATPPVPVTVETSYGELEGPVGARVREIATASFLDEVGSDANLRAMAEAMIDGLPLRTATQLSDGRVSFSAVDDLVALFASGAMELPDDLAARLSGARTTAD